MTLRLLLPHDGSACARSATAVALQLAASLPDVHLTVLHVVNVRPASGNFLEDLSGRLGFEPAIVSDDVAGAKQGGGEEILAAVEAQAKAAGVAVDTQLVTGVVSDTILEHSHDKDLVIMGIRGRTEDRFEGQGGEMSSWLPQRSAAPVLLVPADITAVTAFSLGWDGSPAARHAIRPVRRIAAATGLPVHAIHVTPTGEGGEELMGELDSLLASVDVHKHVVEGARAHQTLVEAAKSHGANVLAVGYLDAASLRICSSALPPSGS